MLQVVSFMVYCNGIDFTNFQFDFYYSMRTKPSQVSVFKTKFNDARKSFQTFKFCKTTFCFMHKKSLKKLFHRQKSYVLLLVCIPVRAEFALLALNEGQIRPILGDN